MKGPLGIVEVKKKHRQRSSSQNAYLHVCIAYLAACIGEFCDTEMKTRADGPLAGGAAEHVGKEALEAG